MSDRLSPPAQKPQSIQNKWNLVRIFSLIILCSVLISAFIGLHAYATANAAFTLTGESHDRTNIMIYGLTADQTRTDSIILASYYWRENKVVLLNIPRDLYAEYDGRKTKIVSLYAIAKVQQPNNQNYPAEYVNNFISKEYNIPIDYWVVVNMDAFKQIIDNAGGVTVNVERPFTDYAYPTDNYSGYIHPAPHFEAGVQTMNGTRALIFARSRHAAGLEGTDFARSKRQQMIIQALLVKLRSQGILTDTGKISSYANIFSNNVFTNLNVPQLIQVAQIASQLNFSTDILMANWNNTIGFLCDSTDGYGAYILRYGVTGNCTSVAGTESSSSYRAAAVSYVQHLLQSAGGKAIK